MNNFYLSEVAKECIENSKKESRAMSTFLNGNNGIVRYVIGRNAEAETALKQINFEGVIDDSENAPASWLDLPIVKMSDVPRHAWVLNCSTSIAPIEVIKALLKNGIRNIVNLCDLYSHPSFQDYDLPWFVRQQREDFEKKSRQWQDLYDSLADEESRKTMLNVFRFRLTANPKYMEEYNVRLSEQYFEPFLQLENETFVDAGGFDGDTTEIFCNYDPSYKKVFFFEPSHVNIQAAKARLREARDICFLQLGLSDKAGSLAFDEESGSSSSVQSSGEIKIEVDRLDDCVAEPVSFIKMDLEGWELHALAGSERHIKNDTPKLAIAVYHEACHFWQVKQMITTWYPDYKIRLRHYTQGWSETVMFFTKN